MAPPQKKKQHESGDGERDNSEDDAVSLRGGKRLKKTTAAAAAAATAPPPPAAATAAAAAAQQQRSLDVLFIVLERQRQAARESRMAAFSQRRATGAADAEWPRNGATQEDGQAGAIMGAGWGGGGSSTSDRAFFETCSSVARTCRAWRAVALNAADRCQLAIGPSYGSEHPVGDGASAAAALRRYAEGGILRALWLRGRSNAGDVERLRDLARSLGVVEQGVATRRHAPPPPQPGLADVLRGLHVLRIDEAAAIFYAVAPAPICRPLPPLLCSLVALTIGEWPSMWAPRRPYFFSRANFPVLRSLDVNLDCFSNCPLEIACGNGDGGGAGDADVALPPPLRRLRVAGSGTLHPPAPWPRGEPLQVSLRSLSGLRSILESVWIERWWVSSGSRVAAAAAAGAPDSSSSSSASRSAAPQAVRDVRLVLRDYALQTGNAPPPSDLAPMSRLAPGLAPLTRLTALRLHSDFDFWPAEVIAAPNEQAESFERARRREWQAASVQVFRPLAPTLRRLDIKGPGGLGFMEGSLDMPVVLPNAITLLESLSSLEVSARQLVSVGPLDRLTALRRLSLEADVPEGPEGHPPVLDVHLSPLSLLETLNLSEPAACLASVIEHGLPRLSSLSFWAEGAKSSSYIFEERAPPTPPTPLPVLRAVLNRLRSQDDNVPLAFSWANFPRAPKTRRSATPEGPRRCSVQELEALVAARGESDEDEDDEHDVLHEFHLGVYHEAADQE